MCGEALFGHLVHALAAYLHLYPLAGVAHQSGVQSLVAIGFRMREPVAEALWMWLVDAAGDGIYLEALGYLILHPFVLEDDAHGQNVVYLLKGDVLVLHLRPDAVGRLDACLYLIFESRSVETLSDGGGELCKDGVQMVLHVGQLLLDITIFLGMLIAETQVLKLFLYLVQAKSVGQRCIDIQSLSCYLVLLVGQLTAQRAHVVQAVGYLD